MQERLNPKKLPFQKETCFEDMLEDIVLQIVDYPDDVYVREVVGEGDIMTFLVSVNANDRGKVIGKQGTTIGALHKLFAVMSRSFIKIHLDDVPAEVREQSKEQSTEP